MNKKIIVFFFLIISIFWIWLGFTIVVSSMPYNSLSNVLFSEKRVLLRGIFPEGFSFFTRNPREPQALIYEADSKKDVIKDNKAFINSFGGFNRYNRSVLIELGSLINIVKNEKWFNCNDEECFDNIRIPVYEINNSYRTPVLCGSYYIKFVEPIPWAWATSFKKSKKKMPFKIIKVSTRCN